ncbi:sensor histidine kinase [Vampirovibrio chlorellavorus]|uniref:sensor histidine kinase n=1 Tax=Vampirovibrio chlorellavorus TaxID=758823 RepID=UPI0026ECE470|nr:ATP-binding protein [Vampirovibrio chlorellavorus]
MGFLKRLIKEKELALLLLTGLAVIVLMDALLAEGFRKDQRNRQILDAERLQAKVESSLEEHVTALIALKVVYQNFTDITHYDFQQYGKSITSTLGGFQRLLYIDPSLTIRQVYPLTPENAGLYNYSLLKQGPMTRALLNAKNSQSPSTSRLIPFLNHPKSFWAFIPIYRNNARHDFLGFAAGEISMEKVFQPLAPSFSAYQIQLIDPANVKLFEHVTIDGTVNKRVYTSRFNLLGQPWRLQLNPVNPPTETLLFQRSSLWVGGLMILFLLGLVIMGSKRHKFELEEAQKQFETIVEASPDGILLLDERLDLQISNRVIRDWLGQDEVALQGRNFFQLFECQCPNLGKCSELSHLLCTTTQFAQDLPDVLETRIIDAPETSPKTLRLNASRIVQEKNGKKEPGFICVLGDISTSKELERVKETYVATLTHDLKTPLLAQQMVLETLGNGTIGPINEEQRKLLLGAKESVHDLVEMVNSTLLFYKLESSHVQLHRQKSQLAGVAKEVMSSLQPLAEKKDAPLELDAAMALPDAWIDVIQMKRVFHNLLSNAISYGRKGAPIRVSITVESRGDDGECLLIEVYNEGKGIPPEEIPKVFDKYYSLSRKFKQIGTGLGLYISRRIVELHGGKLWVTSEVQKQTRFFISLPVMQQVEKATTTGPVRKMAV